MILKKHYFFKSYACCKIAVGKMCAFWPWFLLISGDVQRAVRRSRDSFYNFLFNIFVDLSSNFQLTIWYWFLKFFCQYLLIFCTRSQRENVNIAGSNPVRTLNFFLVPLHWGKKNQECFSKIQVVQDLDLKLWYCYFKIFITTSKLKDQLVFLKNILDFFFAYFFGVQK